MIQPFLDQEMLERLKRMDKNKRKIALVKIGQEEWHRCAEDIFYWMDASRHPIPYVYTRDPHPMFKCNLCNDTEAYHFNKRKIHLNSRHNVSVERDGDLKTFFTELDSIRTLTMMPYFAPIVEAWLAEPLMAIEKSRDMMATWLVILCYTWDTLFHKGRQNIFQSENATKTRELVERSNIIYINQPTWLKEVQPAFLKEGINRAGMFTVPGMQSEIIGFPQGADKIRQYHPSGMFSDEAAFNPEAGESFAAIKPAIQNGGRYTAVSSANPSYFMHICRDTTDQGAV